MRFSLVTGALGKWRRALLDLSLWLLAPAAFLLVYIVHYGVSPGAALPHLRLAFALYCALLAVRVALASTAPPGLARTAQALAITLALAALLMYYALVLIGLQSWGQVITWSLAASYAGQAPALARTVGLSPAALAAALAAFLAVLYAAVWRYLRSDWILRLRRGGAARVVVYGALYCAFEWMRFVGAPPAFDGEPLSLTFFHERTAAEFDDSGLDIVRAHALDRAEDAARAAYAPAPDARRRNVILIVVDSLRPDHLGVTGYARQTTPHLSALAATGRLRSAAPVYAACSQSACGITSLVTSKYVHQFSLRPITLHEALRAHGYRTRLLLSGDHTHFYGLKARYGAVDSYADGAGAGERMNDDRLVVERTRALQPWDGAPVFLHYHLMSTHGIGTRHAAHARYQPAANYWSGLDRDRARAVNYYDNGVVQADALIHDILASLEAKGYLREALVVITSDHGEALGEHGAWAHSNGLQDEELRIPLLLAAYGYAPPPLAAVPAASQVDVAPTILAELGMPAPATWAGMPLQRPGTPRRVHFEYRDHVGYVEGRNGSLHKHVARRGPDDRRGAAATGR